MLKALLFCSSTMGYASTLGITALADSLGWRKEQDFSLQVPAARARARCRCGTGVAGTLAPLEPLGAFEIAQLPIEGAERKMASLAGDLQNEAVGESQRRLVPEVF